MINQDPVILGLLAATLGLIFYTSEHPHPFWKKFYHFMPVMVVCYIAPSLFNTFDIIDTTQSQLNHVASRYIMPSCLTLLIISVDIKSMLMLGPKIIVLFLVGSIGIILGGPLSLYIFSLLSPELINWEGSAAAWRGMATLAGNWIGGTANQLAMKEVYAVDDNMFAIMISVNVVFSALWMSFLLFCANHANAIDSKLKADNNGINTLVESINLRDKTQSKIKLPLPSLSSYMAIFAVAFGVTGFAHLGADLLVPFFSQHYPQSEKLSFTSHFFWIVIIVTSVSIALSYTKVRRLERQGASKISTALLYLLIATMGLKMDLTMINDFPIYFAIGFVWLGFHALLILIAGLIIKAPLAYMAISSQCCIGGAASSPIVAMAFNRHLAPVAVMLSVFGYAWANYMVWICAELMRMINQ
ncbi:DUF819 domain-containing protein [Shewanella ulleungensis]|jgi:uncharacterized membrane protein|uniref:Membrane protein n=1 Tax=Shewanella ulleungensis TaxID=2282699 RepID=A0ABQ2QKD3_9GAMM|nr:DUF819 family protein [Shewanella ulleungensis]MCL1151039.1 DUF819 family protein [Shewanella ulleungensis]GGP82516.1 membrane protein [Shewanella ulleungensis]